MNHGEAAPFGRRDQAWQPKQSTVGDGCHRHNSARKQKLHSMRLDAKLNVFKRIYRLSVRGCVVNVFPFFFLQWVTVASIQLFPSLPRLNCIKLTHFLALLAFSRPFLFGYDLLVKPLHCREILSPNFCLRSSSSQQQALFPSVSVFQSFPPVLILSLLVPHQLWFCGMSLHELRWNEDSVKPGVRNKNVSIKILPQHSLGTTREREKKGIKPIPVSAS